MKYLIVAALLTCSSAAFAQTEQPKEKTPPPQVYQFVEQMPSPGYSIGEFISEHIHYPDSARKKNIEGRVMIQFIVAETGKITDVKVVKGIGYGCDEEAARVIKAMPPWKPGKVEGSPVSVYFTQPITFKLAD